MKCQNCGCEVTNRTSRQNKLYWLWLGVIADETGNSTNVLHEFFKNYFIAPTIEEVFGEYHKIYKSTTDMAQKEFVSYLNLIQSFAASELAITLPVPEDLKLKGLIYEEQ